MPLLMIPSTHCPGSDMHQVLHQTPQLDDDEKVLEEVRHLRVDNNLFIG